MTSPLQLYPLSSQNGVPIPMDAIKPIRSFAQTIIATGVAILPATTPDSIFVVVSTVDAMLSFSGAITSAPIEGGTILQDTVFLPAHTQMTIVSTGGIGSMVSMAEGLGLGYCYFTEIERWSGLGTLKQSSYR